MAVPALLTVMKFLSSQGARKAVQKYGPKAVEKAKNALQLKKGKKKKPLTLGQQKRKLIKKRQAPIKDYFDEPTVAVLGLYGAGKGLQMAAERDAKVQAKKKKSKVEENNDNKMKLGGLIDGAAIKGKTKTRMF